MRRIAALAVFWLLLASLAFAQARDDESDAANGDEAAAESGENSDLAERHESLQRDRAARQAAAADSLALATGTIFWGCTNTPEVGVKANVTKINYYGRLANNVKVFGGGSIVDAYNYSYDTYRRQERTTEARSASASYSSGSGETLYDLLPVLLKIEASTSWSEDITVNSAGNRNVKLTQTRRAGATVSRSDIATGPVLHRFNASSFYLDSNGENLGERSETSDSELSGALRSGVRLVDGVTLATRLYGVRRDGENFLAGFQSKSETVGDSLGVGVYYNRNALSGQVVLTQADFDRSYLDYRRDANGLVDTAAANLPEGASKIVEELEEKDAWKLEWKNSYTRGSVKLSANLTHTFDKQQYRLSRVGLKEKNLDTVDLKLSFPVGGDSLAFTYKYEWKWDDQRFAGAGSNRGRQYQKKRVASADWFRQLFANTRINGKYQVELSQDIAENVFNTNDRDRLTGEGRLRLDTSWNGRFTTSLLGVYLKKDDIAIRSTLSANNNTKTSYEVSPQYSYVFSDQLTFQQTYRMYIQYQDYFYDELENVRKEDTFNKRGNLSTKVTYKPVSRVAVTAEHIYNKKNNGTRTVTDAVGRSSYRRDQDQVINRIDFSMTWDASDWLALQTATYRTRDEITRFGAQTSTTANFGGELWVGAVVDRTWWPETRPLVFQGRVKRFLAYGPNVTNTSNDYWQADILLRWSF